jgi:dinuclear metal center YbgI/SA1388 family protein
MQSAPIRRNTLVRYLDDYLRVASITDESLNGLQVEGAATVRKVAFAVDACAESIRAAARARADMLVVHHGLLWGRIERITGIMHTRISLLFEKRMSLYAAHLPLDSHPEVGNNVELARLLGLGFESTFAGYKGADIGVIAEFRSPITLQRFVRKLERTLETKAVVLPFGKRSVRRAGIVSGDADFAVGEAIRRECDVFITGETSHVAFHVAKEARINVVYGGHYATETVGLRALAKHIGERFSVHCTFIAAPTGF